MNTSDPTPPQSDDPFGPLGRVSNGALMIRAVLDAPDLSDYQRMFGQGVVWSRLLGPALEQVDEGAIALVRASLDVADAALAFRDAGATAAAGQSSDVVAALEQLDAALNRLELLAPIAHAAQAARTEEFLEMLRTDIPAEGEGDSAQDLEE